MVHSTDQLRIVVMGTGPFAVPMFQSVLAATDRYRVLALITRPDKPPQGRGKPVAIINPMRDLAQQHGLQVFEPLSINSEEAQTILRELDADLFLVCDYGQILSRETLSLARLGGINLHGSLLPKYRGAAPINWAIYHGEKETGVTVIHMTPLLDGGPCLVQSSIPIEPLDTAVEVEQKLSQIGPEAVEQALAMLSGHVPRVEIPQDPALVTKAPRLKKTDGAIDWTRSAQQIVDQIRAFQPWPKSHTFWPIAGKEPLRLIIEGAEVAALTGTNEKASGEVLLIPSRLLVQAGNGVLELTHIQPAGKRVLTAAEFLRGYPISAGQILG
ncbi:MAG: methionyl-tRNA formyltransferase [Planctomycetota bacterium]|nr:methionyl-tRNA formyltransferase [Planctomycetota bacterium]